MKHAALILLLAASTVAASAQAPTQPTTPAAKPAVTATKPTTPTAAPKSAAPATKPTTPAAVSKPAAPEAKAAPVTPATVAAVIKAPASILPHLSGIPKPIFTVALRYQEIKIGTGAVAEPNKLYKVLYTGYRASDGVKFDSSDDHRLPLRDKDGKPVMGDDGKPKLGDPQPMPFAQGTGGTIIGFDQGFAGMKVGGKRRIFMPWQLAYGTRTIPDHGPDHPGIPAKSDLIFDVELVEVSEMPAPQSRPGMSPSGIVPKPGTPAAPAQPGAPAAPPAPGAPPKPPVPAAPAPAATPAAAPTPNAAQSPAAVGQNRIVAIGNAQISVPGPGTEYVEFTPLVHVVRPGERDILNWNRPVPNSNIAESAQLTTDVKDESLTPIDFDKLCKRKANAIGFQKGNQFFSKPDAVAYSTIVRNQLTGPRVVAMAVLRVKQKPLVLYLGAPIPIEDNFLSHDQADVLIPRVRKTMQQWAENILAANE
jgi:peptidylprolyl isomerase